MMWKTVQCALRGRGHQETGIPCQDRTKTVRKDGFWMGALADGAGSASHSHYGAQRVVERVCGLVEESFDALFDMNDAAAAKSWILEELLKDLDEEAAFYGVERKALASTLLFVAVKEERMLLGHLGDGVICYESGGVLKVATRPDNGEFANQTVFVTSGGAQKALRLIKGSAVGIDGFCLMSDGTAASLYSKAGNRPMPVLSRLLRLRAVTAEEPFRNMLVESFRESVLRATRDDCSLVLMTRCDGTSINAGALSDNELGELLECSVKPLQRSRQIHRCRLTMECAAEPVDIRILSRQIHLKPKYTKRYAKKLKALGLLSEAGGGRLVAGGD